MITVLNTESWCAGVINAECRLNGGPQMGLYAECRYAECRGDLNYNSGFLLFSLGFKPSNLGS